MDPYVQRYARASGALYLAIIGIALINTAWIDARLQVDGNVLETAENIAGDETLFRLGMALLLTMYAGVIALSGTLYVVLKTVDERLALLAMLFRAAEGVLGAMTAILSLLVLSAVGGASGLGDPSRADLQAVVAFLLHARGASLDLILFFVGIGGTIFCYLFFRTRYVPRLLSGWGMATYLSMLLLSLVSMTFPGHPTILEVVFYGLGTAFEVSFGAWLLLRGCELG